MNHTNKKRWNNSYASQIYWPLLMIKCFLALPKYISDILIPGSNPTLPFSSSDFCLLDDAWQVLGSCLNMLSVCLTVAKCNDLPSSTVLAWDRFLIIACTVIAKHQPCTCQVSMVSSKHLPNDYQASARCSIISWWKWHRARFGISGSVLIALCSNCTQLSNVRMSSYDPWSTLTLHLVNCNHHIL